LWQTLGTGPRKTPKRLQDVSDAPPRAVLDDEPGAVLDDRFTADQLEALIAQRPLVGRMLQLTIEASRG